MKANDARAVVVKILGEVAPEIDLDAIGDDAQLQEELDLDSMDFLNFAVGLHEATGLEIPEHDYPQLSTVGSAVTYLIDHTPADPDRASSTRSPG